MNFTYLENKAMVCMLMTLAQSDGNLDIVEIDVIQIALKAEYKIFEEAAEMELEDALKVVKVMSLDQKRKFASIVIKSC